VKSLFQFAICTSLALSAAIVQAGTFSFVSGDDHLVSGVGDGVSHSVTSSTFTGTLQKSIVISGTSNGHLTASGALQGVVEWTVQWTPDYPGEPVPDSGTIVTLTVTGHHYAKATLGITGSNGHVTAGIIDSLVNVQATAPPSSTYGSQSDSTLGTIFAGTGAFTLVSPGVYQGTIDYAVNWGYNLDDQNGTYLFNQAQADIVNTLTITKIGTQNM